MNPATTRISIIIPTHNRAQRTKHLLDKLSLQAYPKELMEVIVVANSCTDDTLSMLQQYKAPFLLKYAETGTQSPAAPRNKGASMATGDILIFLDDDVDPSEGLAAAHVQAHDDAHSVVIGYLPLGGNNDGYFRRSLQVWWENKFQQMGTKGYRFSYEDLLSGNFSLPAKLFHQVNGFVTTLRCRDDYELGMRLLAYHADFKFCMRARGLHCDEVTDLNRSLKRKREEGRMDVHLWRIHPGITTKLQDDHRKEGYKFLYSRKARMMIRYPRLTDWMATKFQKVLHILEKWRLRSRWYRTSYLLHTYWYYRGLLDELHTQENLIAYFNHTPSAPNIKEADIDLNNGLEAAEDLLDLERPHAATIRFGEEQVCYISYKQGMERLRGTHLRRILATTIPENMIKTLALNTLTSKVG